ncbi:MAG: hypothetical protein HEEMFOPI_00445 [Holosporales bacterium]
MKSFFTMVIASLSLNASTPPFQEEQPQEEQKPVLPRMQLLFQIPQADLIAITVDPKDILHHLANLRPGIDRFAITTTPTLENAYVISHLTAAFITRLLFDNRISDNRDSLIIVLAFALRLKAYPNSLENPNIHVTLRGIEGFLNDNYRNDYSTCIEWPVLNKLCEVLTEGKEKNFFDPKDMVRIYENAQMLAPKTDRDYRNPYKNEHYLTMSYNECRHLIFKKPTTSQASGETKVPIDINDSLHIILTRMKLELAKLDPGRDRYQIGNALVLRPLHEFLRDDFQFLKNKYNGTDCELFITSNPKKYNALLIAAAAYYRYLTTNEIENKNVNYNKDHFSGHITGTNSIDQESIVPFSQLDLAFEFILQDRIQSVKNRLKSISAEIEEKTYPQLPHTAPLTIPIEPSKRLEKIIRIALKPRVRGDGGW